MTFEDVDNIFISSPRFVDRIQIIDDRPQVGSRVLPCRFRCPYQILYAFNGVNTVLN